MCTFSALFPSCQGWAVPPFLAPFEAQKVPFLLILYVLWLELLISPNMGFRPRREVSHPREGQRALDILAQPCFTRASLLRLKGMFATGVENSLEMPISEAC